MEVKVIVYVLTDINGERHAHVSGDYSDNITVRGVGSDGKVHQYDSYEGIHAYSWAEKLGMKLDCFERTVTV